MLDRRGHAGNQPATTNRQHDIIKRRAILHHLGTAACRAIGHVHIIERVQDLPTLLLGQRVEHRHGGHHVGNQHDFRAKVAAPLDPEGIRCLGHHHLGGNAFIPRRPGDGQRMIAATEGCHTAAALVLIQPADTKAGTAGLEGPGLLEQLQLQEQFTTIGNIGSDLAAPQRQDRGPDHLPVQFGTGGGDPVSRKRSHDATLATSGAARQSTDHTSQTTRNPWCAAVESGDMPDRAAMR